MKKIIFLSLILAFAFGLLIFNIAKAENAPSADITAKINLINQINKQIQELQSQLGILAAQQKSNIADLARTLKQGSSGEDVKIVQAILAADAIIYPEGLITGYFGPATARAIAKFQKKHGIQAIGIIGPKTLAKIKEVRRDNDVDIEEDDQTHQKIVCAKVPPGHLIASGWLRKNNNQRPIVPACQKLPPGIAKKIDGGSSSDKTAPVISAVAATNITANASTVNWTTNEAAKSKVYYSTATPVDTAVASNVSDNALVTSHSLNLTGLVPVTTYHFLVQSQDSSNNTATSSNQSFTTLGS
ncbi:MAG: peptidoglycan-binding protein [Patescibacteria group bacterium]